MTCFLESADDVTMRVDLDSEIEHLQRHYGSLCRVVKDNDQVTTIEVRKIHYSLNLRFDLDGKLHVRHCALISTVSNVTALRSR